MRFLGSGIVGRVVAPGLRALGAEKLSNWSGNLTYGTSQLTEATSVEQIRTFTKQHSRFKVLGTRHCFNSIADSRDILLSLKPMQTPQLNREARTVTVEAGITYGQLAPYLESHGFALHNLASLPHISVAGGCSTATHGSGERNGNLATAISGLEFVTGAGDIVKLSRKADGETFRGAVVGLGALGVITRLTLDLQPTFQVRQYVYEHMPFAQMRDHFDAIQASGYSVSLFTDWREQQINEVWIKSRDGAGQPFSAPAEFYGARLATKNLHPIADLSAENCTEQMGIPGPWYERLPHFKMGFTPSAGNELQTEYLLPRRNAIDAIMAVARLQAQVSPHLMISEIRTIAADDLWMSTAYRQDSVAIHFTWKPEWPAVRQVLPLIEKELSPFHPRPHWGKLFTVPPAELRSRYPMHGDFVKLAAQLDPKGKFRNDFLNSNIFES